MVDLLIENGIVVTLDDRNTVLTDGAIAVEGNRIVAVGATSEVSRDHKADRVIDARGSAVLPGIVNVHTHIAAPVFRAYIEDKAGALYNIAFPVEELLSADDIYVLSLLGSLEVIRFGSTCINDIYHHALATAKAVEEVGLRAVLANKVFDIKLSEIGQGIYRHVPEEGEKRMAANVHLIEDWHGRANGRITCRIGTHAADTCTPALLKRGRELADEYEVGLHIHTAQSEVEVAHIRETFGKPGSVEFLYDLGFLGPDVIAVHCTYVTEEGIRLMAKTGTTYALCPSRFLRRGGSRPFKPLLEMLNAGVTTGLGTDWIRMDPWERMRSAISIGGLSLTPHDVLRMATLGSARVLGLDDEIGSLEVGKKADVILINMRQPHLVPVYKDGLVTELVNHVNGNDVETVIIDGQVIMEGNEFETVDEQAILQEAQRVCDSVREQAASRLGL